MNKPAHLLSESALANSSVVANSTMNRDRVLRGSNGYTKELGFDPVVVLLDLVRSGKLPVSWLDLCCGSGKALRDAKEDIEEAGLWQHVEILGVDLVEEGRVSGIRIETASLSEWEPKKPAFDLVTCVHGLHYIGDKLGLLARAARWLTPSGLLAANIDTGHVLVEGTAPGVVTRWLRETGFHMDPRRRLASLRGRKEIAVPWKFLGADDQVGPNYTGQPAVASWYGKRP